jgi:hypothetical protein
MARTEEQFYEACEAAQWLADFHNKSFWVIPTEYGYSYSCYDQKFNLPKGTATLEITPNPPPNNPEEKI